MVPCVTSMPSRSTIMLFAIAVMLVTFTPARTADCSSTCEPWLSNGLACRRGKSIGLRFVLDVIPENSWTSGTTRYRNVTYSFCAEVDTLQSFSLNNASFLTGAYNATGSATTLSYKFSSSMIDNYLLLYGFGNSNDTKLPMRGVSSGAVLVATPGATVCGQPDSVAVVSTLVLDIGLHNGRFNYFASSPSGNLVVVNPDYDAAACAATPTPFVCDKTREVQVFDNTTQAGKTGFVPTCDSKDSCMFDSSLKCIGDTPGRMNCAACYTSAADLLSATLQVWTSYYGTDDKKTTMRSGSNNPLNFVAFARSDVLSTIAKDVKSWWHGDFDFLPS